MAIFKRTEAIFVAKMNQIKDVTISEDKLKFNIGYYDISIVPEDVPGLVSDLIQVYGIIKPTLDKMSEERQKELDKEKSDNNEADKPLDLSEIPF